MSPCRLALILCLSVLFVPTALSQTNAGFAATKSFFVGGTPASSAVADLNRDGIPDVVVADSFEPTGGIAGVAVLLGAGNGNFLPVAHYATNEYAQFVCIADLNGDGNPDILVASYENDIVKPVGEIEVLMGKGDGTFVAAVDYVIPGAYPRAIYTGDFNGDGHVDLAVAVTTTSSNITLGLAIYLNKGDGTFRSGQRTPNLVPFGTADFNRDGKLDLIVGNSSGQDTNSVSILYGAGNGTFIHAGPVFNPSGPVVVIDVAIADFNEDGYPDAAVTTDRMNILLSHPDGSFTPVSPSPSIDGGSSVVAGDFNRDGHMDLAVLTGFPQAQVNVLSGRGDGTFSYRSIYGSDGANGYGPGGIGVADLNHDGYLDLITTNSSGTFSPMFGKPGGTFNAELSTGPGWNNAVSTVSGDFNSDGIPDVAVLYAGGLDQPRGTVSLFQGQGNAHFKPLVTHYQTATTGTAVAVGDINGDGKLDLVVYGRSPSIGSTFGLLLGNGNGTFQPVRPLHLQSTACCGEQLFLADINNDGKLDIVTYDGVSLGKGDGTFQPFIPLPTDGIFATHFAIGDFNDDGKFDIAFITDDEFAEILIFHGDGKGAFNSSPSFSVTLPYGDAFNTFLRVGHFTTNGALGVVAGIREEDGPTGAIHLGEISILGGKGDGTLLQPVTYQLKQDLQEIAVGDFNGDGLDDVAALNSGAISVTPPSNYSLLSLFTSAGDGTLRPKGDFGAGGIGVYVFNPSLSIADFNGDGANDIVGVDGAGVGLLLNSAGSTVSLTVSPNSVPKGQPVSLKAKVAPSLYFSGSVSTGAHVTFYDGTHKLGSSNVVSGVATLSLSSLSVGSHTLTAVYSGNSYHAPRQSDPVTEVVHP